MAKYLAVGSIPGTIAEVAAVTSSAGAGDAGKIVALGVSGRLSHDMLPEGVGATTVTAVAAEALSAGEFVHLFTNAGVLTVEKAFAADGSKPCTGFILASVAQDANVAVYVDGLNTMASITGFAVTDVDKQVVLSATTSGAASLTVPSATGNIIQPLGKLVSFGSTAVIAFSLGQTIVRA